MSISVSDYLNHMIDEALFLECACREVTETQFLADPILLRACARAVEIIIRWLPGPPPEIPSVFWGTHAGNKS